MGPVRPLEGRGIVVTGGGGGIGRGIAMACAAAGAHVVIAARGENGKVVADEITGRGDSAEWVRCDVTDASSIAAAVAAAVAAGGLDAMVHNATSGASSQPHRTEDVSPELFADHCSVSLRGAFTCALASFDALRARQGTLIVMSSPAGMEGSAMLPMYATMKGALRGFGKSLSREWGPHGVTVNIVSPLGRSPAMERAIKADPDMIKRFSARIPVGRVGDPESDVGVAVAFLCSPDARYINGQTIGIDGGQFTSI